MMRKSSASKVSGIPLPSSSTILKARNQSDTPVLSRLSVAKSSHETNPKKRLQQNVKRKRSSAELLSRVSLAPAARNTPNKFITPSHNKYLAVPSAQYSRNSIDTVRSSIGGKAGSSSWPLSEPSFKTSLIDKVLEFLTNNRFEMSINRQMLRSPRGSDFVAIFTFIYSHMCPGYKMTSRVEEEIPKVLKKLKYPVQLPKSSFLNVGTPHTWPAILAMLGWLIDQVILIDEVFDSNQLAFPKDFDDEINSDEVKFQALIKSFHSGGNEQELLPYLSEYKEFIEREANTTDGELQAVERELHNIQDHLQTMKSVSDHLQEYEDKYKKLWEDKHKIITYNEDMKEHMSAKDRERAQIDANLDELTEQLKQVNEQINMLEEMKSQQKLTKSQLNMYKNHKSEMAIQMNHLDMEKKNVNEQIWSLEMETGKSRNRLSALCIKFYNLLDEHQLPMNKISICNLDEEIQVWKNEIVSGLKSEKAKAKEKNFSDSNLFAENKVKNDKLEEMRNNMECEMKKLECKLKRLQEEIDFLKKEKAAQEKSLNAELKSLGDKIAQERRLSTMSLHELQSRLEEKKNEFEEKKKKDVEFRQASRNAYVTIKQQIKDAFEFRNRNLIEMKQEIEKMDQEGLKECRKIVEEIIKM